MTELLPWLNMLLLPIGVFVVTTKVDLTALRVLQIEQQRRLDALEGRVAELRSKLGELV